MAGGLTVAGQQAALEAVFTTAPYLALCSTAPTDTAAGTEATYTGYTRKLTVYGDWGAATAAVPSVKSNVTTISWPQCTAGATPNTLQYVEWWTAASGGVRHAFGTLTQAIAVTSGITPSSAPGQLFGSLD